MIPTQIFHVILSGLFWNCWWYQKFIVDLWRRIFSKWFIYHLLFQLIVSIMCTGAALCKDLNWQYKKEDLLLQFISYKALCQLTNWSPKIDILSTRPNFTCSFKQWQECKINTKVVKPHRFMCECISCVFPQCWKCSFNLKGGPIDISLWERLSISRYQMFQLHLCK